MAVFLITLLKALILPPASNWWVLLLAVYYRRRWPRTARAFAVASLLTLFLLMLPHVSVLLASGLETAAPFDPAGPDAARIQAIVVLGTGRYADAPEYGRDTVSVRTLERLRYGARVHRQMGWPLAVVGGASPTNPIPEAKMMRSVLEEELHVPVTWSEEKSRNTAENASFARALIPVHTILLVTQAMDMTRAADSLRAVGFEVIPAPVGFAYRPTNKGSSVADFIPNAAALTVSHIALYEYLGRVWYRLRY
jgi:uncharacterized SAM-binding protein YcdF (DUF218 family)